ncbi:hypothetical protein DL93DRAFT_2080420 [Clavulina sp. PMI_390]|nr:hypothetical protein DL93DRAFT_2080420 [Clavulina sp. PMI_390]
MPLFSSKPGMVYTLSSSDYRNTTISNLETNEVFWVETPNGMWETRLYRSIAVEDEGEAPRATGSKELVAQITLKPRGKYLNSTITRNGTTTDVDSMFPGNIMQVDSGPASILDCTDDPPDRTGGRTMNSP